VNDQLHLQALQNVAQALNAIKLQLTTYLPQVLNVKVGTYSALPSTPTEGMLAGVTDSNTAIWGAVVAGGGSNHILAYYDGSNWVVAAVNSGGKTLFTRV
jgi:hypothetical protein